MSHPAIAERAANLARDRGDPGAPHLDRDAAGREQHRVCRRQVVVLGVEEHEQRQHRQVDDAEDAKCPSAADEKEPEAGQPDREVGRVHHQRLLEEKRDRCELDVLADVADVLKILDGREPVLPLPDEVGQEDHQTPPRRRSRSRAARARGAAGDERSRRRRRRRRRGSNACSRARARRGRRTLSRDAGRRRG